MYQEKQEENELRALPPASAAHLRALDAAVQHTTKQHGISEEDYETRKAVVTRMEKIIMLHLSGCLSLWASILQVLLKLNNTCSFCLFVCLFLFTPIHLKMAFKIWEVLQFIEISFV